MPAPNKNEQAFLTTLAEVVAARRDELGLSQQTLAKKSSLTRNFVSLIECGDTNPSILKLRRLAQSLELPLTELLRLTEKNNRNQ